MLNDLIGPLLFLLMFTSHFYAFFWAWRPLFKSGARSSSKFQFNLSDMFALMGECALSGLVLFTFGEPPVFLILLITWVVLAYWWIMGIYILSRTRIFDVKKRFIILVAAVPISYVASIILCMGIVIFLGWAMESASTHTWGEYDGLGFKVSLLAIGVSSPILILCRWAARNAMSTSAQPNDLIR